MLLTRGPGGPSCPAAPGSPCSPYIKQNETLFANKTIPIIFRLATINCITTKHTNAVFF